ncbi:hypothetical protein Dsin_011640 [Dipteronia sinensis]|uniref:proteasome endopeptidase complex n=1 Tax=Dipteronia sinensis TaxID=43782 RepID=A0AAE0AH52_9ROSI|nr:hypothetical protein Dsin_011640 [Dipteronia sinensis]
MYVSNRATDKITQLTDNVYTAANSQIVSDYVGYLLDQHNIQLGQPATVKVAANLVTNCGSVVIEQPFVIGGYGSSYLYGFFDRAWKQGMTKQEAEQLVLKALSLAISRDGATGGIVRTVTINSQGVNRNFCPGDTDLEAHTSLLDI